ncbi:MAG: winged helix-turn-helix domain-containing protein [Candidatus Micrarchaeota archaeon]
MGTKTELAKMTVELSSILKTLQVRMESLETRMELIEEKVSSKGASDSSQLAWAKPKESGSGFAGVNVSGSSTPASIILSSKEILLSSIDEQIVEMIRARSAVCAEDVRARFKYKGKNAASARLSRLYELGILEKQQAGRRVYYRMK